MDPRIRTHVVYDLSCRGRQDMVCLRYPKNLPRSSVMLMYDLSLFNLSSAGSLLCPGRSTSQRQRAARQKIRTLIPFRRIASYHLVSLWPPAANESRRPCVGGSRVLDLSCVYQFPLRIYFHTPCHVPSYIRSFIHFQSLLQRKAIIHLYLFRRPCCARAS